MSMERWGSLSVRDHNDLESLVANVLLYDRLIVPVPADPKEEARWAKQGWNPHLLYQRLEALGELVVKKTWDAQLQERYRNKLLELHALGYDTTYVTLPYQVSRMILSHEPISLPEGITHVEAVLAYCSEADLKKDFMLDQLGDKRMATLSLLFGQKIAIPAHADPNNTFDDAIGLSLDQEFRAKRRSLYRWQHQVLSMGYDPHGAAAEMDQLINEYNVCVERASKDVRYKLAFTIATGAIAVVEAFLGSPLVLASGLIAVVQFATLDRQPVLEPGESRPAAMFHDIKSVVEWRQ
jgi:hypothetical protein